MTAVPSILRLQRFASGKGGGAVVQRNCTTRVHIVGQPHSRAGAILDQGRRDQPRMVPRKGSDAHQQVIVNRHHGPELRSIVITKRATLVGKAD